VFYPADVSVDTQGTLWVADGGNNRVSEYTLAGGFLKSFGFDVVPGNVTTAFEVCTTSCQTGVAGGGPGQLNAPVGIAAACNGQVYVGGSNRVQRFGEAGTPLPPCATTAPPPGTTGGDNPACVKAKKQLKAAKAKLKKLKKRHAAAAKITKAKAKVKKAKKKVKKAC
jgi:hypothetical protein